VDPVTGRAVEGSAGGADLTTFFSWLPRAAASLANVGLAIPAGFEHVHSSGLPHVFGD
jgi:hypothetical protein